MQHHQGVLLFAVCFLAAVSARTAWHQLEGYSFEEYIKEYNKVYSPEEFLTRKSIFEATLADVLQHNKGNAGWKKGINNLSDRTPAELKSLRGYNKKLAYATAEARLAKAPKNLQYDISALPAHVDWREKGGIVTAVKDQGQCGSCWSFGSAETLESHWALKTGKLTDLSEQQILDCTPNPHHCGGTGGCQGGTAELAYERIKEMGGLTTEWRYPYVSYFGEDKRCHFNSTQTIPFATVHDYVVLPSNKYEPLMHAIANLGPLAISVDASSWSTYETGVYDGCNQTHPDLDHEVQLVGYGTDEKEGDYWLVRNSWSPSWGENGYIRLKRYSTERCGMDITPSDGDGCDNGPKEVRVCGTCGILYDAVYPVV